MRNLRSLTAVACLAALVLAGCGDEGSGPTVRVKIPQGASFSAVTDSLAANEVIRAPTLFRIYARATEPIRWSSRGPTGSVRGAAGKRLVPDLIAGNVFRTVRLVIPQGWDLQPDRAAAGRTRPANPRTPSLYALADTAAATRSACPARRSRATSIRLPTLFPVDWSRATRSSAYMVSQYKAVGRPERRARAAELGMSEREVVTLASIVGKEAGWRERPTIAGRLPQPHAEGDAPPGRSHGAVRARRAAVAPPLRDIDRGATTRTTPTAARAAARTHRLAQPARHRRDARARGRRSSTSSPGPTAATSSRGRSRSTIVPVPKCGANPWPRATVRDRGGDGIRRPRRMSRRGKTRPRTPPNAKRPRPSVEARPPQRSIEARRPRPSVDRHHATSLAAPRDVIDVVRTCLEAGAPAVQLRDKAGDLTRLAR